MDLTGLFLRAAAGRPHVLLVGVPGADRLRVRVEQEVARRRWPRATAPADADVLVVAGRPGPELAAVVDDVWATVPAPRARLRIASDGEINEALDGVVAVLGDLSAQLAAAPRSEDHVDDDGGGHVHGGHDHGDVAEQHHEEPDQDGGEHHHGGGTELPGGLAMADLGEDRDGLALDRLHVPLGPVLPDWPAGLVVDVVLQGDVIQEARSRFLDTRQGHADEPLPPASRRFEMVARVLGLAGWAGPAARARHLRDASLDDGGTTAWTLEAAEAVEALHRRVRRSRILRWMLRSAGAGGRDVHETVDGTLRSVRATAGTGADTPVPGVDLSDLDARLTGAEFAAARLIVAAADPSPHSVPARSVSGTENP